MVKPINPTTARRPPPIPPMIAPVLIPPDAAAELEGLAEADVSEEELFAKIGVVVVGLVVESETVGFYKIEL